MPTTTQTPKGYKLEYTLHGLELTRAIQRGLRDQALDAQFNGKPRLTSMFCIAYTKWENIAARLTPIELIKYQRDGFSSVAWDMPTLVELKAFHDQQAALALADGEQFESSGMAIAEAEAMVH